jgi:hypothetical protein
MQEFDSGSRCSGAEPERKWSGGSCCSGDRVYCSRAGSGCWDRACSGSGSAANASACSGFNSGGSCSHRTCATTASEKDHCTGRHSCDS